MIGLVAALMMNLPPIPDPGREGQTCVAGRGCFPAFLVQRLQEGQTRESYVVAVLQPLRAADYDSDGLDAADLDLVRQRSAARERAQRISNVLNYDLDGDLRVTREEALRAAQPSSFAAQQVARLFQEHDVNDDGVIDLAEASRQPPGRTDSSSFELKPLEAMMTLARNGRLTARALQDIAEKVFDAFDTDRNGVLSPQEFAFSKR